MPIKTSFPFLGNCIILMLAAFGASVKAGAVDSQRPQRVSNTDRVCPGTKSDWSMKTRFPVFWFWIKTFDTFKIWRIHLIWSKLFSVTLNNRALSGKLSYYFRLGVHFEVLSEVTCPRQNTFFRLTTVCRYNRISLSGKSLCLKLCGITERLTNKSTILVWNHVRSVLI